jgi:hypothetical protein
MSEHPMHLTSTRSIQGNHEQGSSGQRPSTYGGVTKGLSASEYVRRHELKLRGQYRTRRGINTTYIHVREGEFQCNNVLHSKTVNTGRRSHEHAPSGDVKSTHTVSTIGVREFKTDGIELSNKPDDSGQYIGTEV